MRDYRNEIRSYIDQLKHGDHLYFTVQNICTENHRSFRITKQPEDSAFAPSAIIVGLLSGTDNKHSYNSFGFITDAAVYSYKKYRGGQYEKLARLLAKILRSDHDINPYTVHHSGKCFKCSRLLTTPESILRGIGPVCAEK